MNISNKSFTPPCFFRGEGELSVCKVRKKISILSHLCIGILQERHENRYILPPFEARRASFLLRQEGRT